MPCIDFGSLWRSREELTEWTEKFFTAWKYLEPTRKGHNIKSLKNDMIFFTQRRVEMIHFHFLGFFFFKSGKKIIFLPPALCIKH